MTSKARPGHDRAGFRTGRHLSPGMSTATVVPGRKRRCGNRRMVSSHSKGNVTCIDVPNSHWLVDENRGVCLLPLNNNRQLMIDGIPHRPIYLYEKDIIGDMRVAFQCFSPVMPRTLALRMPPNMVTKIEVGRNCHMFRKATHWLKLGIELAPST